MDPTAIEAAMVAVKEYRALEAALGRIAGAVQHEAHITMVDARDDAISDRSVTLDFTKDESKAIFAAMTDAFAPRMAALKAKMGLSECRMSFRRFLHLPM